MRFNWNFIKLLLALTLIGFLMAFASERNDRREVAQVQVRFNDESRPYVTRDVVNKLLIQNRDSITGKPKEKLDLKGIEERLDKHPMIKDSDVYVRMNGQVEVVVVQRQPLARIAATSSYYLDQSGEAMPLSDNYTARVPIVTGIKEQHHREIHGLIKYINQDKFLETQIIGIKRQENGDYHMRLRGLAYTLILGQIEKLERKFSNYKAFYQKAKRDNTLGIYEKVNLKYSNQVVCTKG